MKTNKDTTGLITQASIMVAPQELNDDANWTLVQSKKTRKQKEKERQEHLAQFPPLSTENEGSVAKSKESASSKHRTTKINLSKIFNREKLATKTPKTITIKHTKKSQNNQDSIKQDKNEIISILSSSDSSDDASSISEFTTEDCSDSTFTIETITTSEVECSTTPSVYQKKNINRRTKEMAYSAKSTVDSIIKLRKVKNKGEPDTEQDFPQEQEELHRHKIHTKNNEYIEHNFNKIIRDIKDSKSEINHSTDRMRSAYKDISNLKDYRTDIKNTLPSWKAVLFPVSLQEMYHQNNSLTTLNIIDWAPFGPERKKELKRIEDSAFHYQLKKNGYTHAWKTIYTRINTQCNVLGIPYKNRMKLYQREIEFLSLLLHDVLPENYYIQGIHPNDISVSYYHLFFSPNDSISVARKKWYDFILKDYDFYWDVYSKKIDVYTLSNYDITKLNDLNEIIWFINPTGMQHLLQTPETHEAIKFVYRRACNVGNWVYSRHKAYYAWLMFGWRQLPQEYPSFDSAGPLKPIELSRWIPKSCSIEEYLAKDLYIVERKLTGEEPTWKFYYKPVQSYREKERYISPFTFYPKFDLYNGVKHGQIIRNYTTYFSSKKIQNKREIFLKQCFMKHRQLHQQESRFPHNFSTEFCTQRSREIISTDWLLYYDSYSKQCRDPRFTYGKQVFSARYWEDITKKNDEYPISFLHTFNSNLNVPPQFQISQIFSEYTTYNELCSKDEYITVQGIGQIPKIYKIDSYFLNNYIPSYSYHHTKSSNKNMKEKYTIELPTNGTHYQKFSNIYYQENDDIYQDATENLPKNSFPNSNNETVASDSMHEQGQKISGTNCTQTKNINFNSTPCMCEERPTVHDVKMLNSSEHTENSTYVTKKNLKIPTENYKSPVEYARSAHTIIPSPRSKVYLGYNYFKGKREQSRNLYGTDEYVHESGHFKNYYDSNIELCHDMTHHHKRSYSYDDHDLSTTNSVSSHRTLRTYPFIMNKKYAKTNNPIFEFAFSTKHSTEKKEAILKDQKHIAISLSDIENTPITNFSDSNSNNNESEINNRNINKTDFLNFNTPTSTNDVHTHIDTSLIKLTNHVRKNIMAAKTDFDNFVRKNSTTNDREQNERSFNSTNKHTNIHTDQHTDEDTNKHTNTQTEAQTDEQMFEQKDKQTIEHTEICEDVFKENEGHETSKINKNSFYLDLDESSKRDKDYITSDSEENSSHNHDDDSKNDELSFLENKRNHEDNEFNFFNSLNSASSSSSTSSMDSDLSNSSKYETNKRTKRDKKYKNKLSSDKICKQALNMIKFLGTLQMKKLDLKHEPRQRRMAFLEWIGQLEIAFSSNKYTKNVLKDYSTKNKIHKSHNNSVDILIYTVAYAFMDKSTRISTMMYKNQGSKLLKILHTKCASIDSNTKLRAKLAFVNCRISHEETAINFLTRLEQKANEARNYDMKISEKEFIWVLLNNMKYHRYYKERIASFLTTFELNSDSITQKWIENKFYSLDEERILSFRGRIKENARFSMIGGKKHEQKKSDSKKKHRCKYCYRMGHTDQNCTDKMQKRPSSMPKWINKMTCSKCKKKGHFAFNCPPKYNNKIRKTTEKKFSSHNNHEIKNSKQDEQAAHVNEFAGYTHQISLNYKPTPPKHERRQT